MGLHKCNNKIKFYILVVLTLFEQEPVLPYGFSYYPDFLSEQEELELLAVIAKLELKTLIFQGFEAKRKVESYGYDYHFDTRTISKGKDIPQGLQFLLKKVASLLNIESDKLAEVLVTEYPEGSVINWHRDAPPFDIIIGISLLSNCKFRFRPYDKAKQHRKAILSTEIARRSLYILRDEARTDWEHSIMPVKKERYSITLRTLREG
jgi:alkylated DNA repair dioxygenase AlkB